MRRLHLVATGEAAAGDIPAADHRDELLEKIQHLFLDLPDGYQQRVLELAREILSYGHFVSNDIRARACVAMGTAFVHLHPITAVTERDALGHQAREYLVRGIEIELAEPCEFRNVALVVEAYLQLARLYAAQEDENRAMRALAFAQAHVQEASSYKGMNEVKRFRRIAPKDVMALYRECTEAMADVRNIFAARARRRARRGIPLVVPS